MGAVAEVPEARKSRVLQPQVRPYAAAVPLDRVGSSERLDDRVDRRQKKLQCCTAVNRASFTRIVEFALLVRRSIRMH